MPFGDEYESSDNNEMNTLGRRRFLEGLGMAGAVTASGLVVPPLASATPEDAGIAELPASMRASSALALRTFRRIDGTPVYYWRSNRGNTQLRDWRCTHGFYDRLVTWIRELRDLGRDSGYSGVKFIVSAGFYVSGGGQHGAGTAMDLDHVRWYDGHRSSPLDGDHSGGTLAKRRRYLAVEAVCRRRFNYVLDGFYNAAHRDHIHADVASLPTVLDKNSRSATVFVQACANRFMGAGIAIDGAWGPATEREFDRMKRRLNVSGNMQGNKDAWRSMLARIARHGFRNNPI